MNGNDVQGFRFNEKRLRVLTDKQGEPWFIAKDACDILELSNVGQALKRLDDDERGSIILDDGTPGNPNRSVVSESGLYALVLASRKPEAKEFKRWVTHEVLPSIRRHGAYATGETIDRIIEDPDFGIRLLVQLKREREERTKAENRVRELEPKARALDDLTDASGLYSLQQTAKMLTDDGFRIGRQRLVNRLLGESWLYRENGVLSASQRAVEAGWLDMKAYRAVPDWRSGGMRAYPPKVMVTPRGLVRLHDLLRDG